ncbi:hypothetical protein QWJ34_17905 [Saccharibacillus sp. CPCC 101409]|uniref:DUF3226 domain-containing protein n=1 Tax=Saccharibacillus sp. CPCC 101409 TaxID=3058041 RepID=UPI00267137F2|nr:DUF3226 domain-containing protein [Saccharibacillus sp. CPCC 101409]MDO3411642.1 hypothetical protein [Saccharibacillus sp. CPCC 101409]
MELSYLVVEGPHDVEVAGKVLKLHGFSRIKQIDDLYEYWIDLIPKNFPPEGDLLKRVPVPVFFQKEGYSVAIHSAGGFSKISKMLRGTLLNLLTKNGEGLSSVGVIGDADSKPAEANFSILIEEIGDDSVSFSSCFSPGTVIDGTPRLGIHLFPDNSNKGTLEDLLIESASVRYPELFSGAKEFVSSVAPQHRKAWGLTDEPKVIVGCIANVLKPGKANQVSIQDNDWVSKYTRELPPIKELERFLKELIGF